MPASPTAARPRSKSRASRAAERVQGDGPTLTVVPDPPAPAQSAASVASKLAMVLGQAPVQAAPPGTPDLPPSVIKRAAATGTGQSKVTGEPTPKTPKPKAAAASTPKATTPKVTTPKTPKVKATGTVNAVATYRSVDRYVGTVTLQVEGSDPKVYDCPCPNSHITLGPAITCAGKLLRNHEGGVVSTRTRGRYWGVYQANAEGSEPVSCTCRFGHKTEAAAVACGKAAAAAAGLNAG